MQRWIDQVFLAHPRAMGESYAGHLAVASRFGFTMIIGGTGCLLHGLCPRLFTTTGSQTVRALYQQMVHNRRRAPDRTTAGYVYEI